MASNTDHPSESASSCGLVSSMASVSISAHAPGFMDITETEPGILDAILERVSWKTKGFSHALVARSWRDASHRTQRAIKAKRATAESDPRGMTEDEARNLLAPFPDLRVIELKLLGCPSEEFLEQLANASPKLKYLFLHAQVHSSPAPVSWARVCDILLGMPCLHFGILQPWMALAFKRARLGSPDASRSVTAASEADDSLKPAVASITDAKVSMNNVDDWMDIIQALGGLDAFVNMNLELICYL